jgi:hypothetical protein
MSNRANNYRVTDTILERLFSGQLTQWSWAGIDDPSQVIYGPEPLVAIWNAGPANDSGAGFFNLMQGIADAITVFVRQNGNENHSEPARGEVYYNTVCIQVRWAWIAYPAAVVVLTLLFFAGVVIQAKLDQSRLHKAWAFEGTLNKLDHDFKSSALTLLFHGLSKDSLDSMAAVGSTNREKELKKLAKETNVQLVPTDQGWKLSMTGMQRK